VSRATAEDAWDQKDELLATIIDQLSLSNHLYLQAHTDKKTKLPDLESFPRPWEEKKIDKPRKQSTVDELVGFFGTMAASSDVVRTEFPDAGDAAIAMEQEQ